MSLDGLKPQWKISKPCDVTKVDGEVYIRVCPQNFALNHLVGEDNDDVPSTFRSDHRGLLGCSIGLASLVEMRNRRQAEELSGSAGRSCSLFEAAPPKKPRVVHKRHEQEALRRAPESITLRLDIDGCVHDVDVLRPVHPKDNLFVQAQPDMLSAVLHKIRTGGFSDPSHNTRTSEFPKGIHARKDSFIVKYTKSNGNTGYKSVKTVADALAFQARSLEPVEEEVEEPVEEEVEDEVSEDGGNVD